MKTELQQYKEAQLLQLIRETVDELHVIGDRLEHHANTELAAKQEREQREWRERRLLREQQNQGEQGEKDA